MTTRPHHLNPWNNPCPIAIRRVVAPLPKPHSCNICKSLVELVNNAVIYGRPYGEWPYAYLCTNTKCRAYVGLHPQTDIPLGTLADLETRNARSSLKGVFNRIWQDGHKSRTETYWWLAKKMGIKSWRRDCHIALFTVEQCRQAQKFCTEFLTSTKGKSYAKTKPPTA